MFFAQLLSVRLLFLLLAMGAVFLLSSLRVEASEPIVTREFVVTTGDTLWDISAEITPKGESVRATIIAVKELNDLANTDLVPGQRLLLPTT